MERSAVLHAPRRVAMISVHTSPLEQPGTGDAGGMNVYVDQTARRLARRGVAVEVFTRATAADQPARVQADEGVVVHNIVAGPFRGLRKEDLPGQLCAMTAGVLGRAAGGAGFDVVHSHYWLSGQVGWLAKERWGIPLVHTMHTMGRVKNATLAPGDRPEPRSRIIGEQQVVDVADRLVANTAAERADLVHRYRAAPGLVDVVPPGVDLDVFHGHGREEARARLGYRPEERVVLFAGRLQPLKGPDVLVRAVHELARLDPGLAARTRLVFLGGPSGTGLELTGSPAELAAQLGVPATFLAPVPHGALREHYVAADAVAVPSHSESFGLVALEAQACGTPVVAARVGGLPLAVAEGRSGLLVDGHDPADWAASLRRVLGDDPLRDQLGAAARPHARSMSWEATVDRLLASYAAAHTGRLGALGHVS
jgi:D-inositol-3-phosphate glycosyltransferase